MTPILLSATEKNEVAASIMLYGIVLVIVLIPFIFFLLTLQNTLKTLQVKNQKMKPGHVWFMLIPIFGFIWAFYVVKQISESLEAEYTARNIPHKPKPSYYIGLAFAATAVLSLLPILKAFISLAFLVLLVVYWMNVNQHKYAIQKHIYDNQ